MLWLALHFPTLALDLLGDGGEVPLAIAETGGGRSVLRLVNAAATRHGVRPGLGTDAARALCATLQVRERDHRGEAEAMGRLAAWAGQFTSQVSVEPDALLLELGRSRRLFGGLAALTGRIRGGLDRLGFRAVSFLAPTPEGALRLACRGETGEAGDLVALRERLAGLPLAALPLAHEARRALHEAGLRRLGEVLALPRAGLARRVGADVPRWLDRLLGLAPDPRPPFVPPATYHGRLELLAEIAVAEGLVFPARRLLHELAGFLRGQQLGAQRLDWELAHADRPPTRWTLGLARPDRDAERLLGLLRERLQRLALPAPVCGLALSVEDLTPLAGHSLDLLDGRVSERGLELLERLQARLGPGAVAGLRVHPDHRPERAFATCPPGQHSAACRLPPRPLWLLPKAEPLAVRDGLPWWHGPLELGAERERIEGAWWAGGGVARDYFVARTPAGERLWVYCDARGKGWFLQGFFG